ncbi:MAG: M18 family aminopeptidase [Clostridia bacterium]|nr:M18 family aminopeptidase [Clostridia bacterium]
MIQRLIRFLNASLTAYHAQENAKARLLENGFAALKETEEWAISEGGKYFVERNGALIAFTVGELNNFSYKIVASHLDSPMLKLKEKPEVKANGYVTLNAETYGGGIWYSFFDRPLKIAGQVVKSENGRLFTENVEAPFLVTIPSQAVHINREVNDKFSVNAQTDLLPLFALDGKDAPSCVEAVAGEGNVLSYDLFVVSAETPYSFGVNGEFLASPRIDNLSSVYATLEGISDKGESDGICVAAFFNHEEIGSSTIAGAGGDFLESTLKRIAYALRFDDNEYYKGLASSFLLSVDNAHAVHPAHPEKSDITNKTKAGAGVVIKSHANGAYVTDALSSAVVKAVFEKAGVKHQNFFNRSDMRSGSTLGRYATTRLGMRGADIGLAQLAMHSACECFAKDDYTELVNGITAFYSSDLLSEDDGFVIR